MPSTPTTKSQVQAYRFVLRRMESALVRRDPVMLHDPMRSHKRATIVGAIIGVVGLVVFVLIGVLNPAPPVPASGIVIAQPSGQMYVVSQNPHELIPVFNLASARLLLAAGSQSQQGSGSSSSSSSVPAVVNPTVVSDSQLASMPMGRMTGIQDGPTVLPGPGQKPIDWAVCDQIPRDTSAQVQTGHNMPATTVLVGDPEIGTNLTVGQALLVSDNGGKTKYLVYGHQSTVNNPDDSAVKAKIDTADPAVLGALQITDPNSYRVVSIPVLNAIPTVGDLKNPAAGLNTSGQLTSVLTQRGLTIGQSFRVQVVGGTQQFKYYIAVPGGKQLVTQTTAEIARNENSAGANDIPQITPEDADTVQTVTSGLVVDTSEYPDQVPQVITADNEPVMCLGWHADYSDPQKPLAKTRVTVEVNLNLPADSHSTSGQMQAVQIGQGTTAGKVGYFFMNPNVGGVAIRSASGAKEFGSGPIYVVDPRGIAFSVPDVHTAQILGVADASPTGDVPPAPASIVSLLPLGGEPLDVQAVQRTYDSMQIPDNVGQYMTPTAQPGQ
jgi:type VII secretion protein EccB